MSPAPCQDLRISSEPSCTRDDAVGISLNIPLNDFLYLQRGEGERGEGEGEDRRRKMEGGKEKKRVRGRRGMGEGHY